MHKSQLNNSITFLHARHPPLLPQHQLLLLPPQWLLPLQQLPPHQQQHRQLPGVSRGVTELVHDENAADSADARPWDPWPRQLQQTLLHLKPHLLQQPLPPTRLPEQ